jgi:uncharacterized protein (DUF4415 family)
MSSDHFVFERDERKSRTNRGKYGVHSRRREPLPGMAPMKKRYDFSKSVRNPYLRKAKKQLTIRLDEDTIDYFRKLAEKNGIPYQNLINLYLRDCVESDRKLSMKWE